jgi:hypothetical protein
MEKTIRKKEALMLAFAALAILSLFSCKHKGIEMANLVGTWTFQNVTSSVVIGGVETIIMNPDFSISMGNWNSRSPAFAFADDKFRMIRGFTQFPHFTTYALWEGEMAGEGLMSGKIYNISSTAGPIMELEKGGEFGSFTASRNG